MSCQQCGMGVNNDIHKMWGRYGYHAFVPPPDPPAPERRFPRTVAALQEVTDPEVRYALETLLEELEEAK